MNPAAGSRDGDSLTRTTVHVAGSAPELAGIVRALQRVPGVLLAEADAATGCVTVAHDGAVATAALLSAASTGGVDASIVRGARAAVAASQRPPDAAPRRSFERRRLLIGMAAIGVGTIAIDLLVPDSPHKHLVISGVVLAVWIAFFSTIVIRNRA